MATMFPIRIDLFAIAPSVVNSNMSDTPRNKICWVEDCEKEIKEWPYCEKHMKKPEKLKVPTSPKSVGKPGI